MTASELQEQLHKLIGRYPGFNTDSSRRPDLFDQVMRPHMRTLNPEMDAGEFEHIFTKAKEDALSLLRKWMAAKGIDERTVFQQSEYVLKNAYCGGDAYINKMKENPDNKRASSRLGAGSSRGRPIPVDLLNAIPGQETGPGPEPGPTAATGPAIVSEAAIRRAVESIVIPEMSQTRNELRRYITTETAGEFGTLRTQMSAEVIAAVDAAGLGDKLTAEIESIAKKAASDMAAQLLPHRMEVTFANKSPKDLGAEPRHEAFEEILKWLLCGSHVYLMGPKGSGKTHTGKQLRDALRLIWERPDFEVFFIDQAFTKYEVKGYKGPTGEYIDTMVRRCVEVGGLLFIDEGDMWAAQALGSLNSILANDFGAFPDKTVEVHKDFRCVLAANTSGKGATREYGGRNPLDGASLDRFSFVPFGYDRNLERQVFGDTPWLQYVWRLRDACEETGNSALMPSMRAVGIGTTALQSGLTVEQVMRARIWRDTEPDTITMIMNRAGDPPRIKEAA